MTGKKIDGLGKSLEADALYYVQDCRSLVGNCILWWAVDSKGYTCDLGLAGKYTGHDCRSMRDTDVPWPVEHVEANVVKHVRGDTAAMRRVTP